MPQRDGDEWYLHVGSALERLSQELSTGRPRIAVTRHWEPRVDLIEEDHRLLLKVEIAGIRGEEIQLHYIADRHTLLVRGKRPEIDFAEGSKVAVHQLEIMYGEFQREVALPDVPIDAAGIRAQYRNGFLIVMVPKMERVVRTRRINVRES